MSTFLIYFCSLPDCLPACLASLTDFKSQLAICSSSSLVIYIKFSLQQLNFHCFYAFMLHLPDSGTDRKTEWTHSTVAGKKFKSVVGLFHSTYSQYSLRGRWELPLQIFCSILLRLCSKWAASSRLAADGWRAACKYDDELYEIWYVNKMWVKLVTQRAEMNDIWTLNKLLVA